jgi:hypothetical protein
MQRLGHPALVAAAYNVGSRRLCGWVEERPGLSVDEFVESIPYGATRDYVRTVLRSYGVYYDLRNQRLPDLGFGLQAACGMDAAASVDTDAPELEPEDEEESAEPAQESGPAVLED